MNIKALYRSISGPVPDEYFSIEFGKARLVKEGSDVTIVAYGFAVHWALEYLAEHPEISADLIDLRTLIPWDKQCVISSLEKTGRVIIFHEDTLAGGFGSEIAAHLAENCFDLLDAPVIRCASLETPIPMNAALEMNFLPRGRFGEALRRLLDY